MSYDPEYSVEPSDFPEPPYVKVGKCLNCGRPIYGFKIGEKYHGVVCECWDEEHQ